MSQSLSRPPSQGGVGGLLGFGSGSPFGVSVPAAPISVSQSIEAALASLSRPQVEIDAVSILKRPPASRSASDHRLVMEWLNMCHPRLFHEFSSGVVRDLVARLEYAAFAKREVIFQQGEPADRMYVLIRGSVTMWALPTPSEFGLSSQEELTAGMQTTTAANAQAAQPEFANNHAKPASTRESPVTSRVGSRRSSFIRLRDSVDGGEPNSGGGGSGSNSVRSNSPHMQGYASSPLYSPQSTRSASQSRASMRSRGRLLYSPPLVSEGADEPTSPPPIARSVPPSLASIPSEAPASGASSPVPTYTPSSPPMSNPLYVRRTARSEAKDFLLEPPLLPLHLMQLAHSRGLETWRAKYQLLGTLRAGGHKVVFGEMGLLQPGASRSATIRAEELPTETLTVSKADFEEILKGTYHEDINKKFGMLKQMQLFQALLNGTTEATTPDANNNNDTTAQTDAQAPVSAPSVTSSSTGQPKSSLNQADESNTATSNQPASTAPTLPDAATAEAILKKLVLYFDHRVVTARTVIAPQHSPATAVYFIVSGEVEMTHQLVPRVRAEDAEEEEEPESPPPPPPPKTQTYAGKLAGGYGAASKSAKRVAEVKKPRRRPTTEALVAPPTSSRAVLLGILGPGQCFGELDHLASVGNGSHPFGLRAVTAVSLLVITREDWLKRVIGAAPGGNLGGGLIDRTTLRKIKARDAWRLTRAKDMDERGIGALLHAATPWRSPQRAQIALMQQAQLAQQTPPLGATITATAATPSMARTNIVNPSGQAGWRSIRDIGEIVSEDTLHQPAATLTPRTFATLAQTREPSIFARGRTPDESKDAAFSLAFPSLSSPRSTRLAPHVASSWSTPFATARLVSPSPSTTRLIQAQRASQTNIAVATAAATATSTTPRTLQFNTDAEQKDASPPPHLHASLAHAESTIALPVAPISSTPLAPLPIPLAVGRELGASKSLRELEVDRVTARRREAAALAPKKPLVGTRVSQYAVGLYHAPAPSMTQRGRRFRATYEEPMPTVVIAEPATLAPRAAIRTVPIRSVSSLEEAEPLPEPFVPLEDEDVTRDS